MKELFRTNNLVILSWASAMLSGENIKTIVFDTHTSILEGSIGALPRRLMVAEQDHARACRLLDEAGARDRDVIFADGNT